MMLFRGQSENVIYPFAICRTSSYSNKAGPSVYVGERVSTAIWHSRLGHPASIVFHHLISAFKLTIDGNSGLSSVRTEC